MEDDEQAHRETKLNESNLKNFVYKHKSLPAVLIVTAEQEDEAYELFKDMVDSSEMWSFEGGDEIIS